MSRDNHLQRSRSRSPSRYRNYNSSTSKSQRTPPVEFSSSSSSYRYNSRNDLPPAKRSRFQKERSRSYEKNGGSSSGRGRRRNSPAITDIRRKNHEPSKVLGVFNLHVRTTEDEIRDVFERFGLIDKIVMVKDAKTHGFRGYCFLYFNKQRDATAALEECNGIELKERQIRVDYSLSDGPHVSTPGEYRGKRGRDGGMRGSGHLRPRYSSPMRGERRSYYDRYDGGDRHRSRDRYDSRRSPQRSFERSDYREHRRGSVDRYDRYSRRSPIRDRRERH